MSTDPADDSAFLRELARRVRLHRRYQDRARTLGVPLAGLLDDSSRLGYLIQQAQQEQ